MRDEPFNIERWNSLTDLYCNSTYLVSLHYNDGSILGCSTSFLKGLQVKWLTLYSTNMGCPNCQTCQNPFKETAVHNDYLHFEKYFQVYGWAIYASTLFSFIKPPLKYNILSSMMIRKSDRTQKVVIYRQLEKKNKWQRCKENRHLWKVVACEAMFLYIILLLQSKL